MDNNRRHTRSIVTSLTSDISRMGRRSAVLACALLLGFPAASLGQETTGNIEGRVVESRGLPIPNVGVRVSSQSLQGERTTVSGTDGYFAVFKLPVGLYSIEITHPDYIEMRYDEVRVQLGSTTTLGVVRLDAMSTTMDTVVVTAQRSLIDPVTASIGTNLTARDFRDLPVDRDYQSMPVLLPHANESYFDDGVNFSGSPGNENKYFVDGVETTEPSVGASGTSLPYNFIQEVQVKTGGYAAEYRSSLGGIVNVVSRSGGDEFHGQGFGFFINNQLTGSSRLEQADYALYDMGMSLGGPIKRDRLWFFGAYNPSFTREDVDVLGVGTLQDKKVKHIFAGKLDWKAGDNTRVNFTATGDPEIQDAVASSFDTFVNADPVLSEVRSGGVNLLARATHTFADDLFLETSVSAITRRDKEEPAVESAKGEVYFLDRETGIASGGILNPRDSKTSQITADVTATLIKGRHTVKGGLAYRDNSYDYREDYRALERWDDTTFVELRFQTEGGSVHNRIPSVFLQDTWRVADRLRINAGLRWDGQYLIGSDGRVAQKILDQYQPRIGFVYEPGDLGSQKVFGSAGRFYQELHSFIVNQNYNENSRVVQTVWNHDPRVDPSGGSVYFEIPGEIRPPVDGLEGQYYDEFSLGYERQVGSNFTAGVRGIYRNLGQGIEDALAILPDGSEIYTVGNPGKGVLSGFPEMKREYTALEFTAQLRGGSKYSARASYVFSRNYGNYRGLYGTPNFGPEFDLVEVTENSTGHLNNDRPHVLKLSGFYELDFGLSVGTAFWYQSGTPMSILEGSSFGPPQFKYAQQRGTASPYGTTTRTPDLWNLDLRFAYDLSRVVNTSVRPRLILDILHVGSQREAVDFDQIRSYGQDETGNQIEFNPNFGRATSYQPPMAFRLGMEADF